MKKTKMQKGITLIALILTIVVLLIIAVVTIGSVQESGIIGHAQDAASSYTIAQEKERIALAYSEYQIQKTINADIEPDTLSVDEATIEPIGNFGWKVSYDNTGNVYGINSKGEYDEAITRIIEASKATGVGLENFIVYEDKGAINKNAQNSNIEGYTKIPEKYIFYNWSTVTLEEIDKLEARTITSQPENTLICDMSNRTLAYDLNGDGYIDKEDGDISGFLTDNPGMVGITERIPEYTMEKNIKYSSLLGYGGDDLWCIEDIPVLFCINPEDGSYSSAEWLVTDQIVDAVVSLKEIFESYAYYINAR